MTNDAAHHQAAFDQLRQVRAEALEYQRKAAEAHEKRKVLIRQLIDDGVSQSDIARELGVSRQAIQKMLTL